MPLLDHFAYPLKPGRPWTGFHAYWANAISSHLNRTLPPGWFVAPEIKWKQEGDTVVVEESDPDPIAGGVFDKPAGGVAVAGPVAKPKRSFRAATDRDVVEVRVIDERGGSQTLAGVVELVSPTNKSGRDDRDAFLSKAEAFLTGGVGVVVIDIVTESPRSLHRDLMMRLGDEDPEADPISAAAYRLAGEGRPKVDVWHESLRIGQPLPEMPLCLKDGPVVPVPLEPTYLEACGNYRIDPAAVLEAAGAAGGATSE